MTEKETYYCIDDGQGLDHRCVTFYDGKCGKEERCRFHMSETLKKYFADEWNRLEDQIEQGIKDDIAETLGLRSSEQKVKLEERMVQSPNQTAEEN